MFDAKQDCADRRVRFQLLEAGAAMSVKFVFEKLSADAVFRSYLNQLLAESSFAAFRWETPAVTVTSLDRPFQFVLHDSPGLERPADTTAFVEHFNSPTRTGEVIAFPNLRGDASMIVPCPLGEVQSYGHLAAFVRHAPESQRDELWALVGRTMLEEVGSKPIWLSTAGMGVAWLHVRLDSRPKYYGYQPYKDAGFLDAP